MITEFELPGFPWPTDHPTCPGCRVAIPTGVTADYTASYTAAELTAWLNSVPPCGVPEGTVFPDPRGLTVTHNAVNCDYRELPPVVLCRGEHIADQALEKLWRARRPC
ncbi:hypothetical protein [Streptomyces griseorubiginosus]|uniref:hypothetical protein n=1 Tax=Streptomyces griseorubiginosus TaxID=67304 RepID=UPI001AD60C23|nr:hypothetical protein [Streptomyces griseorubiginosus]MBO4253894.1 hypothetical protein [Streptomyces griseorubiginosus]